MPLPQPRLHLLSRQVGARLHNTFQPHGCFGSSEQFAKDEFIEHPKQPPHIDVQRLPPFRTNLSPLKSVACICSASRMAEASARLIRYRCL